MRILDSALYLPVEISGLAGEKGGIAETVGCLVRSQSHSQTPLPFLPSHISKRGDNRDACEFQRFETKGGISTFRLSSDR